MSLCVLALLCHPEIQNHPEMSSQSLVLVLQEAQGTMHGVFQPLHRPQALGNC